MDVDYLILGGGCAGLGLAVNILHSDLKNKRGLILEGREKYTRDKTWCSWGVYPHQFQSVVSHHWENFTFKSDKNTLSLSSVKHPYQHVNSLDYYQYAQGLINQSDTMTLQMKTRVEKITPEDDFVSVDIGTDIIRAKYVFDGRTPKFPDETLLQGKSGYLLQAFLGCHVRVDKPIFDISTAIIMDSNLSNQDAIGFYYELPFTPYEALIEPTFFFKSFSELKVQFNKEKIYQLIKEYLAKKYHYSGEYTICYEEQDVLPMIDFLPFDKHPHPRIYTIGSAAGLLQPGTGYAFVSIQRYNEELVKRLSQTDFPTPPPGYSDFIKRVDNFVLKKTYYMNSPNQYVDSIIKGAESMSGDMYARFMHNCLTDEDMSAFAKNTSMRLFL